MGRIPRDALPVAGAALVAAGLGAGVEVRAGEELGFAIVDLLAGWALLAAATVTAVHRDRPASWCLLATGAAWFAGTLLAELAYAHRPLLVAAVVVCKRRRLPVAAILGAGAVVVLADPAGAGTGLTVVVYSALVAVTGAAVAASARAHASSLAGRVLQLEEDDVFSGLLAELLADPALAVHRGPDVPPEAEGRRATAVGEDGRVLGWIVHSPTTLDDARLAAAVVNAARAALARSHLDVQIEQVVRDIASSNRRLVDSETSAGRELERQLQDGPARRLAAVAGAVASDAGLSARVEAAAAELAELARGLHPRQLEEGGLAPAIATLGRRAPVPVAVDVPGERHPPRAELTAYFVCAEGLTNVAKYAPAARATVTVRAAGDALHVEVRDDGRGGADPAGGTGLRGLHDRLRAVGGTFAVASPPGGGTRLSATIPLVAD